MPADSLYDFLCSGDWVEPGDQVYTNLVTSAITLLMILLSVELGPCNNWKKKYVTDLHHKLLFPVAYNSILLAGCLNARVNTALRLLNVHILMPVFSMGGEEFREASKFKDMTKNSLYAQDNCFGC